MTGDIVFIEGLRSISPSDVRSYLAESGWECARSFGSIADVWGKASGSRKKTEIMLPMDRDLDDYDSRAWEFLCALERHEGRQKFEIVTDMARRGSDVLRVRSWHGTPFPGALYIGNGVEAIRYIQDMLISVACSSVKKESVFQGNRPSIVNSYINETMLGPSESGSYVFTVISPLLESGEPKAQYNMMPQDAGPMPFGRTVIVTLALALSATTGAAETAMKTGSFDEFKTSVRLGVSANLCDAVVGLAKGGAGGVDFGISWSRRIAPMNQVPTSVKVHEKHVDVIDDARRVLRESVRARTAVITGIVERCKRGAEENEGIATIKGFINGVVKTVRVTLPKQDYEKAVDAHKQKKEVRCEGPIETSGTHIKMPSADRFDIIDSLL